jgi:hypothetical protein
MILLIFSPKMLAIFTLNSAIDGQKRTRDIKNKATFAKKWSKLPKIAILAL